MPEKTRFTYTGRKTREISFPLGGIGTGSIGLAGNGRLIDWEIFNKPNKGSVNGFSHFAIRAEQEDRVIDARILNGDLHPPYSGPMNGSMYNSFGFGPWREHLSGLPHFAEVDFTGEFPLAWLDFKDASENTFPGQVRLMAFNPFIPLNEFDSGIPAAMFAFEVTNTTHQPLTYQLTGTLSNPLPASNLHTLYDQADQVYLHLRSDTADGDLTLAVQGGEISSQAYWFRGAWFDNLEVYWQEQSRHAGRLKNRSYPPSSSANKDSGSLASRFTLQPQEMRQVRFVIAWNFPTYENDWNDASRQAAQEIGVAPRWKNYYATRFESSFASAQYALESWDRLYADTLIFKDALYTSTLDPAVIEAVAANLSVLKTAVVARLEDGTFYGFEGAHQQAGCCEGSCTHVWNYTQAAPFLFPSLERSMRSVDFNLNQRADGAMRFRLPLPAVLPAQDYWSFHPCADGQFGNVLKTYADWKISGDTEWLRQHWLAVKRAIEFAWAASNEYRWDPEKSGVLTGRMHHTLDMELFGPSSWLNGFYLAALKAGAEMAVALDEPDTAREYSEIFARGKAWTEANLFNGEYYVQRVDLGDRTQPERFGVAETYWDEEHSEIKYQIGEGCEIDQLLAQWHANLYGLGEIFDPAQARTALESLYKYNFKPSMRSFYNPCRIFALNDEAGLVMCSWPDKARKPVIPVPYSQEVMTGFEYAAASLMIQSGLVEEGLQVVRAVRDRYDGEKRNPWNEIECGSNYARTMASYALLLAFSGFRFDLTRGLIGFDPLPKDDQPFQVFWSIGSGWGVFRRSPETAQLEVLYGDLKLTRLELPFLHDSQIQQVELDGQPVDFHSHPGAVTLGQPVHIHRGQLLAVRYRSAR